jgi:hypothetical protein
MLVCYSSKLLLIGKCDYSFILLLLKLETTTQQMQLLQYLVDMAKQLSAMTIINLAL